MGFIFTYKEITELQWTDPSPAMDIYTQQVLCQLLHNLITCELVGHQSPAVCHLKDKWNDNVRYSSSVKTKVMNSTETADTNITSTKRVLMGSSRKGKT